MSLGVGDIYYFSRACSFVRRYRKSKQPDAKNSHCTQTPTRIDGVFFCLQKRSKTFPDQHAAARLLVHSGANVCLPDARGLTCLRLTVEMADAPTVALLLAAEPPADLSVQDEVLYIQSVHPKKM